MWELSTVMVTDVEELTSSLFRARGAVAPRSAVRGNGAVLRANSRLPPSRQGLASPEGPSLVPSFAPYTAFWRWLLGNCHRAGAAVAGF